MKTNFTVVVLVMSLSCSFVLANEQVESALNQVVTQGCLSNRRTVLSLDEWGPPEKLFIEPQFTNLVSVVRRELVNCDFQYVNGLTGLVKRVAFASALTKCGVTAYHDSVVRWLGQNTLPPSVNVKVWHSVLFPIGTNMEDYLDMHFDDQGISNILTNVRLLYCAAGVSNEVAAIDWILSGESKKSKVDDVRNGLLDRIRDGSSE